jgi:transposase
VEVSVVDIVEMFVESARREDPTIAVRIGYEPVDDFAWKRGQRCGTIVCDLERRRIIDLLTDRQADRQTDHVELASNTLRSDDMARDPLCPVSRYWTVSRYDQNGQRAVGSQRR